MTHEAALGLRAHSGWAALVALGGPVTAPIVLRRCRVELADRAIEGSSQAYHTAEKMPLPKAAEFVQRCNAATAALSAHAVQHTIAELSDRGYSAQSACVLLSSARPLPDLKSILASHALIHTAEGEFYRDALRTACSQCGLATMGVRERELPGLAAERLNISAAALEARISELGKTVGPPWRQDEKLCALASWVALMPPSSSGF